MNTTHHHHHEKKKSSLLIVILVLAALAVGVVVMNLQPTAGDTPAKAGTGNAQTSTGGRDGGPVPSQEVY